MKTTTKKTTRSKTTPDSQSRNQNADSAELSASAGSDETQKKRPTRRGRRGGVGRKRPASKTAAAEQTTAAESAAPSEPTVEAPTMTDETSTEKKRPSRRGRRGGVGRKRPASKTAAAEQTTATESAAPSEPTVEAPATTDENSAEKKRPSRRGRRGGVGRKRPASKTAAAEQTDVAESAAPSEPTVEAPATTDEATTEKKRPSRRGRRGGVGRKRPASKAAAAEQTDVAESAAPSEPTVEAPATTDEAPTETKRPASRRRSSSKRTSNARPQAAAASKTPSAEPAKTTVQDRTKTSRPRSATKRAPASKKPVCRMIFAEESSYSIAVITEDGNVTDFWVEEEHRVDRGSAGSIYCGVVSKVIPALQAAFVDIGLDKEGFLSFQEMGPEVYRQRKSSGSKKRIDKIEDALRPGDKVLVQMAKEAIGDKGPALTSKISMPGRFLIYMPYTQVVRMSRQLNDKERKALYELAEQEIGTDGGLIFRTASAGNSAREIRQDLQYLTRSWKEIQSEFESGSKPKCLHRELHLFERVLRDHFSTAVDEVVLYHPRLKYRITQSMKLVSPRRDADDFIRFFDDPTQSIWKAYNLTKDIDHLFSNIVYLDCGGYIIIEEMETLTAIDVNSGKNVSGKDLEAMISTTNQEAAVEVARQMRLRQLGGIIIVDFIDMRLKRNQDRVFKTIERELAKDRTPTDLQQFTDLGLVQITRQRSGRSLTKRLTYTCAHCKGSGRLPLLALTK